MGKNNSVCKERCAVHMPEHLLQLHGKIGRVRRIWKKRGSRGLQFAMQNNFEFHCPLHSSPKFARLPVLTLVVRRWRIWLQIDNCCCRNKGERVSRFECDLINQIEWFCPRAKAEVFDLNQPERRGDRIICRKVHFFTPSRHRTPCGVLNRATESLKRADVILGVLRPTNSPAIGKLEGERAFLKILAHG